MKIVGNTAIGILMSFVTLASLAGAQPPAGTPGQSPAKPGKLAPKPLYVDPVYGYGTDPVLCFNAEQKKWFMFYTSRRGPGIPLIHGSPIGIATSDDGGATWTYLQNAEIDYTKGLTEYTYWAPEVIYHEGTYHMYLSFVPGIFDNWNHPREIVHLTSKDMLKWKFESVLDLKSDRVIDACVIQLPNGKWRMWYKDETKSRSLSYADSNDLVKWEPKGNAVTDHNGEGPKVIHWKSKYWLIADIWAGQHIWSSDDCMNWKAQENTLPGNHGDAVVSGDRAFFFYFTNNPAGGMRGRGRGNTGADANAPAASRGGRGRSLVINVTELEVKDGKLTCDPNQPTYIQLLPQREEEK
jgi:hypothetical protein